MAAVHFGYIFLLDFHGPADSASSTDTLHRALELASGPFESAWTIDHLQSGDEKILEGYTMAAYMAGAHPNLMFGNTVLCQSYRNPALLAKMAATLQFLCGGRFILGLGAGWNEEEYLAYGYPFPSNRVRVDQLEEALQIIRLMWSGQPATFEGAHYRVNRARCEPLPDPLPPIVLGAFGPRMLRLAARYANGWNVSSTGIKRYQRLQARFERACKEEGRDPGSVRRSWGGGIACAATQELAEDLAGERFGRDEEDEFDFVGTPKQIVDQMHAFMDLGVQEFMLDCAGFPNLECLRRVIEEVIPAV